jgi:hypothetical protein
MTEKLVPPDYLQNRILPHSDILFALKLVIGPYSWLL